jgi:hypothetical protein
MKEFITIIRTMFHWIKFPKTVFVSQIQQQRIARLKGTFYNNQAIIIVLQAIHNNNQAIIIVLQAIHKSPTGIRTPATF